MAGKQSKRNTGKTPAAKGGRGNVGARGQRGGAAGQDARAKRGGAGSRGKRGPAGKQRNRSDSRQTQGSLRASASDEQRISSNNSAGQNSKCSVSAKCGACQRVDMPYEDQLAIKDSYIADLFADVAAPEALRPIIGMEEPWAYRNKVMSPFAPGRGRAGGRAGREDAADADRGRARYSSDGRRERGSNRAAGRNGKGGQQREILCGMYAAGTHRIIDTSCCLIENAQAKQVIRAIRSIMLKFGIEPYDEDRGTGFIRHAVVRVGHTSGEVLVTIVTNGRQFPSAKAFCRELVRRCPFVTTVVQNINERQTNVVLGQQEQVLYGPGFILDKLCGMSFRISSQSFYQVNSVQTEVLYRTAVDLAGFTGAEHAIDAYCGTGTIGLVAASMGAARVTGVDSVASAIRDARQNARHNGVENAEFVTADASEFLRNLAADMAAAAGAVFASAPMEGHGIDAVGAPAKDHGIDFVGASESSHMPVKPAASAEVAPAAAATFATAAAPAAATSNEPLILLMDPPRAGSTEEFLTAAAQLAPERIVYISCNPETQVRDLAFLRKFGYIATVVQPVDMFPHTNHVETVVLVSKA